MSKLLKSKILLGIFALALTVGIASSAIAADGSITKTLKKGMRDVQVKYLQQTLNEKGYNVDGIGAGSAGKETTYFGLATVAAVKSFQAANQLTADGIFGAISRAALVVSSPVVTSGLQAGCSSTSGFSSTTGASCATGVVNAYTPGCTSTSGFSTTTGVSCSAGTNGTTPVVTTGVVTAALATTNPAATTLATGTASNPMLAFTVSNGGATALNITGIKLTKIGYFANTDISGVAIYDGAGVRHGNVVTTLGASGVANMTFVTDPIVVAAGQTMNILAKVDILGNTDTGLVGFTVNSAADITGATVTGTFPLMGNLMSVVNGTNSIAAVKLDELPLNATGVNINADANSSQEIAKFRVQETSSNEDVNLYGLTLWNNGNAAGTDYKDVKLVDQTGTVLATVQPAGQNISFVLATPYLITKGQTKDFTVKATIINGASRTIQFVVYNNYDLNVKGVSTGASLLATVGTNDTSFPIGDSTSTYNKATIASGSMVFSRATDSPSSAVTPGVNDVVLAKYNVKPIGEDYELRGITFGLNQTSVGLTGTVYVKVNGSVVYSAAANTTNFPLAGTATARSLSSYPILTAGTDNTIEVTASVNSSATSADAYYVNGFDLTSAKRLITNDITDPLVSPQTGFTRAVQAASVSATTLSTPVAASVVPGTNQVALASFELNASTSGEDVRVSSVTVTDTLGGGSDYSGIANLIMKDAAGVQMTTSSSTSVNANTVVFNFTNPIIVTRTGTTKMNLFGDLMSTTGTSHTFKINLAANVTATGSTTGNTVVATVSGAGQLMTATASGKIAISTVSGAGATPSLAQLGLVNQADGIYIAGKLTSQYEAQKITSLTLKATGTALVQNNISNIRLYAQTGTGALVSTTPFASASQFSDCTTVSNTCVYTWTSADNLLPMTVVPGTPVTIFVKADIQAAGVAKLGNDFYFSIIQTPQVSQDILSGTAGTAAVVINGTTVSVANTGTLSTTVTALKNAIIASSQATYVTATENAGTTVILTSTIPGLGFTLTGASVTTTDTISTTTQNAGVAAKGAVSNVFVVTASSTGSANNSAATTIVPFQVLATGDSPVASTTTLSSVATGTVIGRFKVMNNGAAQVTLTNATFTDSGTNTPADEKYNLYASSENSSDYTTNILMTADTSTSVAFGALTTPITINGGSYRYITVTIKIVTAATSGDTWNLSLATLGALKFSVTEANLGYDGNQNGTLADTITALPVDGKPALGTIQKQ